MTSTSPDLPRPNRRGFSGDATMSHTVTMRPRKRRLGSEQRRALRLLSCNPFGLTEAIMRVHGFMRPMLAKLVCDGLAAGQSETGKAIAVSRIRITDARPEGDRRLTEHRPWPLKERPAAAGVRFPASRLRHTGPHAAPALSLGHEEGRGSRFDPGSPCPSSPTAHPQTDPSFNVIAWNYAHGGTVVDQPATRRTSLLVNSGFLLAQRMLSGPDDELPARMLRKLLRTVVSHDG